MNNNVDKAEIEKFSAIADKWWDRDGPMKMLHDINDLRLSFISTPKNLHQLKILDIGCGAGLLTEAMAKKGAIVTGIDLADKTLEIAKKHAKEEHLNIDYHLKSVEKFAHAHKESYDIITCMEVLEHVPNPRNIVASCSKLLKKNGKAYYSTINRTIKAYIFAIIIGEYILNLIPKGTHHYANLIKPDECIQWNKEFSLHYEKINSFMYNPLTKKFKLKEKKDINYIMQFSKLT